MTLSDFREYFALINTGTEGFEEERKPPPVAKKPQ
jgi:hypothetical protein